MARPLRIQYPGAFYHVIQRGIERKNIFISDRDKKRFLAYLDSAHAACNAIIHAYILMPNHYHLILETPRGNLSKIMHYLNTSYAAYFNTSQKRTGPLYQGRFKAILVQQDEYLHHLSGYIHLNPVKAGIANTPDEYNWSSYRYFISKNNPPRWLNTNFILSMFNNDTAKAKKLYKQFVLDDTGADEDIIKTDTIKGCILGNKEFFESIKAKFIDKEEDPEIPILKELKYKKEPSLNHIKHIVEEKIKDNKRLRRRLSIYLSRKFTQKTLNQIARFYGKITDTGITQAFKRTQIARDKDTNLNKLLSGLEEKMNLSSVET